MNNFYGIPLIPSPAREHGRAGRFQESHCTACGDEIEQIETNDVLEWAHVEMHPRDGHLAQPVREVLL